MKNPDARAHTNLRDSAASPVAMETEVHIVSLH